jgi:ABC-type phosphate/phosphonate transport system substrate-binding protein
MYDADRAAVRAWWHGLAAAMRAEGLRGVPDALSWPTDLHTHWRDPELLLGQTCGYPLVTQLRDHVQVVGALRYTAPGCAGIGYRSELVVRHDDPGRDIADFRGGVAAFNDRQSHSGFNALRSLVAPLAVNGRFFARAIESGSHRGSLALVRSGRADIACIDCVTLAGLLRAQPSLLEGLHVIGSTARVPGLPLITALRTTDDEIARLRAALAVAASEPALADARAALFIGGFEGASSAPWQVIDEMRRSALALGCSEL